MGVFDKIKNALFEEEYVEVDEKPKTKPKKEKIKKEVKKEVPKVRENKPIAKKVVLPEKREEVIPDIEEEELLEEDFEITPAKKEDTTEFKFPAVSDTDFEEDSAYSRSEPQIVKVIEKEHEVRPIEKPDTASLYHGKKETSYYGIEPESIPVPEYGAYEKKEDKSYFKPSPIISPIYGILDKNYKKEEIVTKREVRLTSSYAREHLSVDDVRKKAFGSLADDIALGVDSAYQESAAEPSISTGVDEDDNLLVDLSADDEKPKVHEVTMGDAEEYFQDLGLEYNIDYKDASKDKERATGRRVSQDYDKEELVDQEVKRSTVRTHTQEKEVEREKSPIDIDSDDNLFDLIDSMYEEDK